MVLQPEMINSAIGFDIDGLDEASLRVILRFVFADFVDFFFLDCLAFPSCSAAVVTAWAVIHMIPRGFGTRV